jgi:hypothetical protein
VRRKGISIDAMADWVEAAFGDHYRRTSTQPDDYEYMMLRDKESSFDWSRHGDPVVDAIAEAAGIDESIASDVQAVLEERHSDLEKAQMGEECPFDSDSHYEGKGPNDEDLREGWRRFERSLKTEMRFFNRHAESMLKSLFEGLADHATRDGRRVVVQAGPGQEITSLYRARVFQSEEPLVEAIKRPDIGLGPPPYHVANGGRMNAYGISVFYGALEPLVALGEIRPPVGSRVLVGQFTLLRELRLLDVEALKSVFVTGSIFDPGYIGQLARAKFLGRLSDRITRPVMPSDEPSDYLVTQAIADYLASEVNLDGIIYPSAQAGDDKKNIVLFHHAARVRLLDLPPDTELSASTSTDTEDGPEASFWVWEEVPPEQPQPEKPPVSIGPFGVFAPEIDYDLDGRKESLAIELKSLDVHDIRAVTFATDKHTVHRHRSVKRDNPF